MISPEPTLTCSYQPQAGCKCADAGVQQRQGRPISRAEAPALAEKTAAAIADSIGPRYRALQGKLDTCWARGYVKPADYFAPLGLASTRVATNDWGGTISQAQARLAQSTEELRTTHTQLKDPLCFERAFTDIPVREAQFADAVERSAAERFARFSSDRGYFEKEVRPGLALYCASRPASAQGGCTSPCSIRNTVRPGETLSQCTYVPRDPSFLSRFGRGPACYA